MPDDLKGIGQNVPEQELLLSEEQIAGIGRAIRHDPKLRRASRAPDMIEFWIVPRIRQKTGAEDRTDVRDTESVLHNFSKLVKRNHSTAVLPVSGIAIDQIELLRPECKYVPDQALVHFKTEDGFHNKLMLSDQRSAMVEGLPVIDRDADRDLVIR